VGEPRTLSGKFSMTSKLIRGRVHAVMPLSWRVLRRSHAGRWYSWGKS